MGCKLVVCYCKQRSTTCVRKSSRQTLCASVLYNWQNTHVVVVLAILTLYCDVFGVRYFFGREIFSDSSRCWATIAQCRTCRSFVTYKSEGTILVDSFSLASLDHCPWWECLSHGDKPSKLEDGLGMHQERREAWLHDFHRSCWDSFVLSYLVDPASSHMLVSKIKPCKSQYKHLYCETAESSLYQL